MLHILWCEDADKFDRSKYETLVDNPDAVVYQPLGTRLLRIVRVDRHTWLLWTATKDYRLGTYTLLHDDGRVERVTARADEGDETLLNRPSDREIQAGDASTKRHR